MTIERKALERCLRLFDEALPKFNWGASFLDANAIALLNEVPGEVRAALTTPACHEALVTLLRAIRPKYGTIGSRDCDVTAQRKRVDQAIKLLGVPAEIGSST